MTRIEELSVVRTKADFAPDPNTTQVITAGRIGTVVHCHPSQEGLPDAVMVEFECKFGNGPDVVTIPESVLELVPAISNIPPTTASEFFTEGPTREVTPIVTGYQLKFCCPQCGNRWEEILPTVEGSACDRCGHRAVMPHEGKPLDADKVCPAQSIGLVDLIIDALNSALSADPRAISMLFGIRVPCNQTLADHPTVQVLAPPEAGFTVSAMGVINAVASAVTGAPGNADGLIAVEWDIAESRVRRFLKFPTGGVVPIGGQNDGRATTILQ